MTIYDKKFICSNRKSRIDQHIQTAMHKNRIETLELENQQLFLLRNQENKFEIRF